MVWSDWAETANGDWSHWPMAGYGSGLGQPRGAEDRGWLRGCVSESVFVETYPWLFNVQWLWLLKHLLTKSSLYWKWVALGHRTICQQKVGQQLRDQQTFDVSMYLPEPDNYCQAMSQNPCPRPNHNQVSISSKAQWVLRWLGLTLKSYGPSSHPNQTRSISSSWQFDE